MSLFIAEPKIYELEALVIGAPQDIARFKVSVDVARSVQESKGLQHIPSAVLDEPHRMALIAGPHQELRHAHIQQL